MAGHYLIHVGNGDERKSYDVEFDKMPNVEFIAIERQTGLTMVDVAVGLMQASAITITAVIWVLRMRDEPDLLYDNVHFTMSEVEIEDLDEKDRKNEAAKKRAAKSRAGNPKGNGSKTSENLPAAS